MKILLFSSAYNGMCQRVHCELEADGHQITIELSADAAVMQAAVDWFQPDLIVCPFLKHRVPAAIWREHRCLIVHPGIEGDRGASSLDWAIDLEHDSWGVTLLQADEEMDAGDIWATQNFPMREAAKASLYRHEVTATAVHLLREVVDRVQHDPGFVPKPLDYTRPDVRGKFQPLMRQGARRIDWSRDGKADIVRKINAADSFPGVIDTVAGQPAYLFGARAEARSTQAAPGTIIGHRDGAICRAARDGCVWIRQLKLAPQKDNGFFKLPALQVLTQQSLNAGDYRDLDQLDSQVQQDINVVVSNAVAYVTFDFYNGAMNTEQCQALLAALRDLRQRADVRVIALLGGNEFWSNGIHLNCIEAAEHPGDESWRNINAIDDVVREIITMDDKITVAGLRCNAGAGGAIMPLACDLVCARDGVVLNPHYLTMGLYGSEYWTYLLPRRVGHRKAQEIIHACLPVLASAARGMGMVDKVFPENWELYHLSLIEECESLACDAVFIPQIEQKQQRRIADECTKPLKAYRAAELRRMKATFSDPDSDYHQLRYNFVHKVSCGMTPARLARNAPQENAPQEEALQRA